LSCRYFRIPYAVFGTALAVAALLVSGAAAKESERWRFYHAKAARGDDKLKPLAATFFGSGSTEEFVAAGVQPDGSIVAFGNAWGPEFPETPKPLVLGKGRWHDISPYVGGREHGDDGSPADLAGDYPNVAGLIVRFDKGLAAVKAVTRFDWGVAKVLHGVVAADGGLIIAGRSTAEALPLWQAAPFFQKVPRGSDRRLFGAIYYEGLKLPGDVFVARLAPDAARLQWVWVCEGHRDTSRPYVDGEGAVWFDSRGLKRISPDGRDLKAWPWEPAPGRRVELLAADPGQRLFVRGGDLYRPGFGRRSWRQPILHGYDDAGRWVWQAYPWDAGLVVQDRFRLVAESSVRAAAFAPGGDLILAGWSRGARSVLERSPIDLAEEVGHDGFRMVADEPPSLEYGKETPSLAHLARLDPKTLQVRAYTLWAAYLIAGNQANSATIREVLPLADGSVAFRGAAATCLIQTPGAWVAYPADDVQRYKFSYLGEYVSVLSADFTSLRFSSYVPACEVLGLGAAPKGLLVAGRARADDGTPEARTAPLLGAVQPRFGGGRYDAHLILLGVP
jgi:hypothetical protein